MQEDSSKDEIVFVWVYNVITLTNVFEFLDISADSSSAKIETDKGRESFLVLEFRRMTD